MFLVFDWIVTDILCMMIPYESHFTGYISLVSFLSIVDYGSFFRLKVLNCTACMVN